MILQLFLPDLLSSFLSALKYPILQTLTLRPFLQNGSPLTKQNIFTQKCVCCIYYQKAMIKKILRTGYLIYCDFFTTLALREIIPNMS